MKTTWIKYVGFLGFFGFLGFHEKGMFTMFMFFSFFTTYRKVRHDELFEQIVNKACRNAFIVTALVTTIFVFTEILFPNPTLQELDIAIIFGLLILTFCFSIYFYDKPIDEMEDAPWHS
ncbi:DUF3796 domain-containing protein [Bacillus gaemokensis]|uniref:DUF3796 domain-containing protein n=1 Tax=Bacillus gaemokensis TaxID=574375 RepID=A0A073K9R4_9BACI|nr:DUF3796 domain-containing protein [Bacillus gaemokensis]KEK23281.1 hypothetical protein BAGA_10140 [Bacillus gaemokensis]KYG28971.1 hypothetical protein AZF08_14770 [Bacillus gaemokensis]